MKKKYRIIFFLIGVAGFIFLIIETDPGKRDWAKLITPKLPLLFAALVVLWAVIYMLHTMAYRLIIGHDADKIRRIRLYQICVAGFALNEVTPFGLIGGEPYRIMELKRYLGTEKATSVTLTFSVMYIIGHTLVWITGILLYLLYGCPGETVMTTVLVIVMVFLIALCYAFFNLKNSGIILPLLGFLSKIPFLKKHVLAFKEKNGTTFDYTDSSFVRFRAQPSQFLKTVICEYGARILEGCEYFLIFRYLGEKISVGGGVMILTIASLVGNLLFMIPMQAGTREGGITLAADWLGIDPAAGVIGGLLYRVRYIICILIGVILILIDKDSKDHPE